MIITDPRNGNSVKVTEQYALKVAGTFVTQEHESNHVFGEAYNMMFTQNPSGADKYVAYMKNLSDTDIVIEGINIRVTQPAGIKVLLGVEGIPVGATNIPANLNAGSGKDAYGTFLVGDNITGISNGTQIDEIYFSPSDTNSYNFDQDVIVPKNHTFALQAVASGAEWKGIIVFNYHEAE